MVTMKAVLALALLCFVNVASANTLRYDMRHRMMGFLDSMSQRFSKPKIYGHRWPPTFCNGLKCPKYTPIKSTKEYELREYEASQWVTTNMKGMDYNNAIYPMFMRLFQYISGQNDRKEKVPMTCPVINRIIPGQGPACESNFNMSFFVPPNSNPPKPSDPNVALVSFPKIRVYVRSFGGFATTYDTNREEALKLIAAVKADNKDKDVFVTTEWYTAGYDAPFKLFNRHNEVLLLAK